MTRMKPEAMAKKLTALGWRVQPPIDQKTCPHTDRIGSGGISSDGSGYTSWYCRACEASHECKWGPHHNHLPTTKSSDHQSAPSEQKVAYEQ